MVFFITFNKSIQVLLRMSKRIKIYISRQQITIIKTRAIPATPAMTHMMYYDQFNTGKRIQKLRRERYLTQEELAVRLNVSDRHLRSLESGEYIPSIDLFIEIAAFFDVTLDHLIMGKSLSDQEESLRNKLQQKRLTNQKLRLKLQRIMQKLSAIAEEL